MKEKYLVSLQEVKSALDSKGAIDTGDISWDSLHNILELVTKQEQEINFLKTIYRHTEEFKRIEKLAEGKE